MKYLSLFSGIGGFEVGIENSKWGGDFECIGFSEIDKYATSIYKRHFPKHKELGDCTQINTDELDDFDLLVGGFPCQSFSREGFHRGFDDCRGTLFFEIARILKDKRPKYFLLENVYGLLYHNKGETFKRILGVLSDLGYNVEWKIFNSEYYGVAQKRERIFIRGFSRERESNGRLCCFRGDKRSVGVEPKRVKERPVMIKNGTKKGYLECGFGDGVNFAFHNSKNRRGRVQPNKIGTLNTSCEWGVLTEDYNIRKLIPVECERLQGFNDNWTQYGCNGELISNNQRYKTIGNAVTTNVITHIMNNMEFN